MLPSRGNIRCKAPEAGLCSAQLQTSAAAVGNVYEVRAVENGVWEVGRGQEEVVMEVPGSPGLNHYGHTVQVERLMIPFLKSSKCLAASLGFFLC